MLANQQIRNAIREAGLKQWQVAEVYGLHEANFSRLMRKELSGEVREKVLVAIDQLKNK
jgi:predicted XRE-type DNA-binding protein